MFVVGFHHIDATDPPNGEEEMGIFASSLPGRMEPFGPVAVIYRNGVKRRSEKEKKEEKVEGQTTKVPTGVSSYIQYAVCRRQCH